MLAVVGFALLAINIIAASPSGDWQDGFPLSCHVHAEDPGRVDRVLATASGLPSRLWYAVRVLNEGRRYEEAIEELRDAELGQWS